MRWAESRKQRASSRREQRIRNRVLPATRESRKSVGVVKYVCVCEANSSFYKQAVIGIASYGSHVAYVLRNKPPNQYFLW
jgi:hypothetical protein